MQGACRLLALDVRGCSLPVSSGVYSTAYKQNEDRGHTYAAAYNIRSERTICCCMQRRLLSNHPLGTRPSVFRAAQVQAVVLARPEQVVLMLAVVRLVAAVAIEAGAGAEVAVGGMVAAVIVVVCSCPPHWMRRDRPHGHSQGVLLPAAAAAADPCRC